MREHIDGTFWFGPDKAHKAVVSVKGRRNLEVSMIRDLDAVIAEQKAAIGVFLTLDPPTSKMTEWAMKAGTFAVEGFPSIPRIQIVPIERALKERERAVQVPLRHADAYKKAAREESPEAQGRLGL